MMTHDDVRTELLPQGGAREPEGFLQPRQCHGEESQSGRGGNRGATARRGEETGGTDGGAGPGDPGAEEGDHRV